MENNKPYDFEATRDATKRFIHSVATNAINTNSSFNRLKEAVGDYQPITHLVAAIEYIMEDFIAAEDEDAVLHIAMTILALLKT